MSLLNVLTQRELDRLLAEGREIARDVDTYDQFTRNRDAVLLEKFLKDTLN